MKFAHISDTHIKNLKYHYEYRVVFEQLYEKLREEQIDYIIHCGDIAHTKTQISPEFVEMCSDFFRNLAEIAPTYIILGNHDGNLKNSSRQDALTPIVDALNLDSLHLLKDSGEVHLNEDFCLNVLSVFDEDNWCTPSDPNKINIALYHGSISGVKTDTGWVMKNGEHDIGIFDEFDFGFLGDIHKTNQKLDAAGKIRYSGSTIQQNHGETNDKGLLLWEIEDKESFTCRHVEFKNPKPFVTIELTPKGKMPYKVQVPSGARLRLVSNNNLPLDVMKRAVDIAKHRFKPESISFLNRAAGERGNVEELTSELQTENLRDINIQEELIDEYLKDYQVDSETLEKVYELNRKYNKIVEENEEVSRNINWKLKKFEFDNLFNYGEKNSVNFEELNGITGVFGKNFSGKSSIIDGVLWTLFNTTSKNERKNLNVINQNKEYGSGKVVIEINEKLYTIERKAEKYIKRLKGEETLEAKTDLNFEVHDTVTDETRSLNGLTRNHTDANIRKYFGTLDDFSVSSLASQHGALSFIDEGSTRRKEIIAKFLDLEIFDKKFKMANADCTDLKGALKRLEDKNYDEEIAHVELEHDLVRRNLEQHEYACASLTEAYEKLTGTCEEIKTKIDAIPAEIIDIVEIKTQIGKKENQITSLNLKIDDDRNKLDFNQALYGKISNYLENFELDKYNEIKDQISGKEEEIERLEELLISCESDYDSALNKERLLSNIPCGTQYPSCKFIRDAHITVARKPELESERKETQNSITAANAELVALEPATVNKKLDKYGEVELSKHDVSAKIADLNLEIARNRNTIQTTEVELEKLKSQRDEYEENKEAIENLELLVVQLNKCKYKIEQTKKKIDTCNSETLELYKEVGSLEQKVISIREQKAEYQDLRREYSAYDLLMQCMHANGIAYDIIKKKIPVINSEIAKVLANVVDFEVFFETNKNKFDIFIKHPKHAERPIEMTSGAEKTMTAMALRLALLSVSSLPKSDLFILDEPGTALDEENMEGFIRILELIKVYFKNVLLISHLDSLKDCVDMQIVIDKKRGYAKVNH